MKGLNLKWLVVLCLVISIQNMGWASSHREAPYIANDPLADNVDVYAFRSPDAPNTVTLIATYVPLQLPHGGPNYYSFGENIRYEIHVDNNAGNPGDEIIYRFTFNRRNEDPTTFFNIRLGQQNLRLTYTLQKSTDGGRSFYTIIKDGIVPPNDIGARSIESPVGLATTYEDLINGAITTASTGERVFAGPVDDPFFVDLGGIFDLGDAPRQEGAPRDGVACFNTSALVIQVPIKDLLRDHAPEEPTSILDPNYVIGVWASASRRGIRFFHKGDDFHRGRWVQVSRLGMPLTNEAVIPIGKKDFWNSITPYQELGDRKLDPFFYNPELALYMDDDQFGGAVPAFTPLRIQRNSLGAFDFGNGQDGLFPLKGSEAVAGTALDDAVFGTLLLPGPGLPRSVDLWPIFHTGVPNAIPYQLATGKDGNPLAAGKPFINNFLPSGGDMLRLNMAVPPTPRDDPNFSSLGLIQAAVLGLVDPNFNATPDLQFIPNMDGFPNGRRLEDDVTRIELQAVAGAVLAAVGLWYDDFDPASGNPVTPQLLGVLGYTTGVENNDKAFRSSFPYLAAPWRGSGDCFVNLGDSQGLTAGAGQVDLELSVSTDEQTINRDETFNYEVMLSNTGKSAATGVTVSIPLPEELVVLTPNTAKGTYNRALQRWEVGTLEAGESASIEMQFFAKTAGSNLESFIQVSSAMGRDVDSKPGNDLDAVADEDDEETMTFNVVEAGKEIVDPFRAPAQLGKIFPVPAHDVLNVSLESAQSREAEVQLLNSSGIVLQRHRLEFNAGSNNFEFNIEEFPTGVYFLTVPGEAGQQVKQKFVVVKQQ